MKSTSRLIHMMPLNPLMQSQWGLCRTIGSSSCFYLQLWGWYEASGVIFSYHKLLKQFHSFHCVHEPDVNKLLVNSPPVKSWLTLDILSSFSPSGACVCTVIGSRAFIINQGVKCGWGMWNPCVFKGKTSIYGFHSCRETLILMCACESESPFVTKLSFKQILQRFITTQCR